ncbi:MAG: M10 family metallopeptidase C-terminal domain-containing protein [Deltaproteobacteria bacterium]|nr:M10 family metallopeptidase C-terminal domain-containing protein [Deltaproteobacteria bacterium]
MLNSYVSPSGNIKIDSLLDGARWGIPSDSSTDLTFSFPSNFFTSDYSNNIEFTSGWSGLNNLQQYNAELALAAWAELVNVTFVKVSDSVSDYGDIRFVYSDAVSGDVAAWSYTPSTGYIRGDSLMSTDATGDVWINPDVDNLNFGTYGYSTLIHELGHALGLKHPFEVEGLFPAINSAYDDTHYSIMSYTAYEGAGYVFEDNGSSYSYWVKQPVTPMLHDILAMQYIYGANMSTRTGDDIYVFAQDAELKTIWDAGGNDTFDVSNQLTGVHVSLIAGTFSDIGYRQQTPYGPKVSAEENIAIAYGVVIENITGSNYDDILIGNDFDNIIFGGLGSDNIDGGLGNDIAKFIGNLSDYLIDGTLDNTLVVGTNNRDTLVNIEYLQFNEQLYSVDSLLNGASGVQSAVPTQQSEVDFAPDEGTFAYFLLEIGNPISVDASVNYATRDGSANAGVDYVATRGIATINAGETFTIIEVEILHDDLIEGDETFYLAVTDPQNGGFEDSDIELLAQRTIGDLDLFG